MVRGRVITKLMRKNKFKMQMHSCKRLKHIYTTKNPDFVNSKTKPCKTKKNILSDLFENGMINEVVINHLKGKSNKTNPERNENNQVTKVILNQSKKEKWHSQNKCNFNLSDSLFFKYLRQVKNLKIILK
jgi:hypothetical protein